VRTDHKPLLGLFALLAAVLATLAVVGAGSAPAGAAGSALGVRPVALAAHAAAPVPRQDPAPPVTAPPGPSIAPVPQEPSGGIAGDPNKLWAIGIAAVLIASVLFGRRRRKKRQEG
jgi:hypothetical protein